MSFNVGDRIRFKSRPGGGIVKEILLSQMYQVLDEDGFSHLMHVSQLLLDQSRPEYFEKPIKTNKDYISKTKKDINKKLPLTAKVDLHFKNENIELTNTEIIEIQLNKFKTAINSAIFNHQKEVIVVHGIGKGVLKKAVFEILVNDRRIIQFIEINEGSTKLILKSI